MHNTASAYQRLVTLALTLLGLLAPGYVHAALSHRTTLPFPDRAQHAAQQDRTANTSDHHLTSNPNPTRRVGARDGGKAAAARRWVGASPTQSNDGDVAAIAVFTRPSQREKGEYGKGGRLLKKREWSYEYDRRGRRTAKIRTLGETVERTEYDWDGRDKLRTIRKPDGTRLDYSYDVFGRRVSKTRSGGPLDAKRVEFLWDGEVLAWELDTERGPRAFVHEPGGFEPILQQQSGETHLCVNDHLGMTKELIDGEGRLAWAAAHSAYGKVIATEGPGEVEVEGGFVQSDGPRVESPFRLLGQVNDEDAELAWTRFRCFDAETGTWISTDPLELDGGLNLYGFDGSPSDVVDPLGLATKGGGCSQGRKGAFRQAKRDAGIPQAQQPESVQRVPLTKRDGSAVLGTDGKPIMTREYTFRKDDGTKVVIQDHSAGHKFGEKDGTGDQGPHFNVRPPENTRTGKVPGTQEHYSF